MSASARSETSATRRLRRLRELDRGGQMKQVNEAVRQVWEQPGGRKPDRIRVRPHLLLAGGIAPEARSAPMAHLIKSRGVALRFYLLALFETQCRPEVRGQWKNNRSLSGRLGWADLIAIDAAYSRPTKTYQPPTKQNRDLISSRDRQVKGALRTLEDMNDQALVVIPRKDNRSIRDYSGFRLMRESGRGALPTPDFYTVPDPRRGVIEIPAEFFLNGWIQVLYPSEIATWLTLRFLRSAFPARHEDSGVYLYGQVREKRFHLLRDTYEDGCQNLIEYELIRRAPERINPASKGPPEPIDWGRLYEMATQTSGSDENERVRYQANRYQLNDAGLKKQALPVAMTTFHRRMQEGH